MCNVCVVIPVYKPEPTSDEVVSIRRTVKILGQHDISFVCPDSLDITVYKHLTESFCSVLIIKRFSDFYFKDINGYNRLLLSLSFYTEFNNYKYILICQPDAYVFRDELREWCNKGYDFIGAPIIGSFTDQEFSGRMRIGNGGFSLRNVQTVIGFFNAKKNVFSPSQIAQMISLWKKPWTRIFVWLLMILGWRNKPDSVASRWKYNEDDFWSGLLVGTRYSLRIPAVTEAIRFAFERFPSELYRMNHSLLPFGCHAWKKYQYETFWTKFIDL